MSRMVEYAWLNFLYGNNNIPNKLLAKYFDLER